jgi:hypothetical protein
MSVLRPQPDCGGASSRLQQSPARCEQGRRPREGARRSARRAAPADYRRGPSIRPRCAHQIRRRDPSTKPVIRRAARRCTRPCAGGPAPSVSSVAASCCQAANPCCYYARGRGGGTWMRGAGHHRRRRRCDAAGRRRSRSLRAAEKAASGRKNRGMISLIKARLGLSKFIHITQILKGAAE